MEIRIANKGDMHEIFALRYEVFAEEQNVPGELSLTVPTMGMHILGLFHDIRGSIQKTA